MDSMEKASMQSYCAETKEKQIKEISVLLDGCNDVSLLDLIKKLLKKSI